MNATTLARSAKLFSGTTASLPHVWSYGKRAYRTTQKRLAEIDALRACQLAISLSTWNRENAFVMLYTLQTPAWRVRDRQSTALGKRGWIYEEGMRRQIAFDASNKVTLYTSHGAINSSFLQLARLDLVITYTWGWMKQRLTTSVCAHSNIMHRICRMQLIAPKTHLRILRLFRSLVHYISNESAQPDYYREQLKKQSRVCGYNFRNAFWKLIISR